MDGLPAPGRLPGYPRYVGPVEPFGDGKMPQDFPPAPVADFPAPPQGPLQEGGLGELYLRLFGVDDGLFRPLTSAERETQADDDFTAAYGGLFQQSFDDGGPR